MASGAPAGLLPVDTPATRERACYSCLPAPLTHAGGSVAPGQLAGTREEQEALLNDWGPAGLGVGPAGMLRALRERGAGWSVGQTLEPGQEEEDGRPPQAGSLGGG